MAYRPTPNPNRRFHSTFNRQYRAPTGPGRATRVPAGPDQQDRQAVAQRKRRGDPRMDMPVRERQKWLRSLGYNIAVDGIWGPMSTSAMQAARTGRSSKSWNSRNAPVDDPNRHAAAQTPNNQPNPDSRRPVAGANQPGGKPMTVKSGRTGRTALPQASAGAPMLNGGLDPEMYAEAMMDAEYGPILAELLRQEQRTQTVGTNRMAEMGDMYKTLVGDMRIRGVESAGARARTTKAIGGMPAGLQAAIAMGGDVQTELAARGDIATDTSRQLETVGNDFDRRMAENAEQGGAFAQEQVRREMQSDIKDIGAKRLDTTRERAAKGSATRMELEKFLMEYGLENRKLDLSAMETIAGIQGMDLDDEKTAAEIAAIRSGITNDQYNRKKTLAEIADLNRGDPSKKPFPRTFKGLNYPQRKDLGDILLGDLENTNNPQQAVKAVNARLRSMGYAPFKNKAVGRFAFDILKTAGYNPRYEWWGLGKGKK